MLRRECNKMFIRQKGLLYLIMIVLIKIVSIFIIGYDSNYMIDENESYYLEYINQYGGKITQDTKALIEQEYERIYHQAEQDYVISSQQKAFQVIYHQYTYQKDGGYLFDTRGWQTALEHNEIDYILLFGIVIISTLLFATEYDTEMYVLLLTSKKGKYRSVIVKLCLGIGIAGFLAMLFQLLECLYLCATIGLPYGNCALSCLETFENTLWKCSLWKAYVLASILQILGAIFVALTAMAVVSIGKKTVVCMIVSTFSFLIADILFGESSMGYHTPIGMLKATGYFFPSQYVADVNENGNWIKICTFEAITLGKISSCLVLFVLWIVALFGISFFVFSKSFFMDSIHKIQKRKNILAICLMALFVTSCSNLEEQTKEIKVSIDTCDTYSCEDYTLEIDFENNTIVCYENGKKYELVREVIPIENTITCIFVSDNKCYYLMENQKDSGIYIRYIDMETFSDKFVYSNLEENTEDFYGLLSQQKDVEDIFDNIDTVKWFFVTEQSIFLQKNSTITKINKSMGYHENLANQVADNVVTYKNGVLVYYDCYGKMVEMTE